MSIATPPTPTPTSAPPPPSPTPPVPPNPTQTAPPQTAAILARHPACQANLSAREQGEGGEDLRHTLQRDAWRSRRIKRDHDTFYRRAPKGNPHQRAQLHRQIAAVVRQPIADFPARRGVDDSTEHRGQHTASSPGDLCSYTITPSGT